MLFWGVWIIIPLIVDILEGIIGGIAIFIGYLKNRNEKRILEVYPKVTIIIPVYNSSKTLEACINSITNQSYPLNEIEVYLVDNGSIDESQSLFYEIQRKNPNLRIWYLDSSKGKAKALNKGLYMAKGKYIINIDSDGILDKDAIFNIVYKFQNDDNVQALTGVVLTDYKAIKKTKSPWKKLLQKCELFEYAEAFLIGRAFQSETNTMFTLAGACSAFRKDAVLKTQLYNGETLGEDTHMTSQIRSFTGGKIELCNDAFFYVEPIESIDKIYIQRQRWQRGGIEVSTLFKNTRKKTLRYVLSFTMVRDHTLVFPRLIWMFAMIYLIFIDYPIKLVVGANIVLYFLYVLLSSIYFCISRLFLKNQEKTKKYMAKNFFIVFILPIFRIVIFFIRAAGILNAIEETGKWQTKTLTEELNVIKSELRKRLSFFYKVKDWINSSE